MESVDWTDLAQGRDRWWELLNMKIKLYISLAGVPGVARDDKWRNPIPFFP
jgi:hypothetical protein